MTITINQIQYVKSEVLKMVMTTAHNFTKEYGTYKLVGPLNMKKVWVPMSFRKALKKAWAEVKQNIIKMEAARNRKIAASKAKAEAKAAYEAITTAQKLEHVNKKISKAETAITMDDTYAVWAHNRTPKNNDYINKLYAEKARLEGLVAA